MGWVLGLRGSTPGTYAFGRADAIDGHSAR